jgi:hypothetical protein
LPRDMRKIPVAKAGNMAIPFQSEVSSQLVVAKDAARDCGAQTKSNTRQMRKEVRDRN